MAQPNGDNGSLTVFVSYTHDNEAHRQRVLDLVQRLREHGLDVDFDQFHEHEPPHSWPLWMYRKIADAARVIVICTETYKKRAEGEEEVARGLGAAWEGEIITHEIYQKRTNKFVPVVFGPDDVKSVPYFLEGTTRFDVGEPGNASTIGSLTALVNRLHGVPTVIPAPLGPAPNAEDLHGLVVNQHPRARLARALELEMQGHYEDAAAELVIIAREEPEATNAAMLAAARNYYRQGHFDAAVETLRGQLDGPLAASAQELLQHVQAQADVLSQAGLAELAVRYIPGSDDWATLCHELHTRGVDAVLGETLSPDTFVDLPSPITDFTVAEIKSSWEARVVGAQAVRRDLLSVTVEVDAVVSGTGVMARADAVTAHEAGQLAVVGEVNEHYVEVHWSGDLRLTFSFDRRSTYEDGVPVLVT